MDEQIKAYKEIRIKQNLERKALREECLESVSELCTTMLYDVRTGVAQVYSNQKKIKDATLELQESASKVNNKIDLWVKKYNGLNSALRGLGDIRHWAQAIRKDLNEINDTLEQIVEHKKTQQQLKKSHENQSQSTLDPESLPPVTAQNLVTDNDMPTR